MKKSALFLIQFLFVSALCATTHQVTVQNNFFSPRDLVIEPGDTVVWSSIEGFHNVNGSQAEYPDNPESFINGDAANSPWSYTFVFDEPGFYNYHCDPHRAINMLGTITVAAGLVITEIMYNPPEEDSDSLEFLEILNTGSTVVEMKGYSLDGVTYTFPDFSLGAGEYVLISSDSVAFTNNFGRPAFQWADGLLNNGGETVQLFDAEGAVVDSIRYDDEGAWPSAADGNGASLVLCDVTADNNDPANWQTASTPAGIAINALDVFANPGAASQCLEGAVFYILEDDLEVAEDVGTVSFRVVLKGAGGTGTFSVFSRILGISTATTDVDFNYPDDTMIEFTDVQTDTMLVTVTIIDDMTPEALEFIQIDLNFPSDGAAVDPLLDALTITIQDNDSEVADLVISEIMYNNPGTDSLEYLELFNNDNTTIDLAGYSFSSGITYTFPAITLQAGDYLVLATDSVAFERNFNIAALQWTDGSLSNGGELLEIRDALGNIVDVVDYEDEGNWPSEADGDGGSLVLCDMNSDNNVADNWEVATKATGVFAGELELFGSPGLANDCADLGDPNFPAYGIGLVTTVHADGQVDSLGITCQLQGVVYGVDLRGGGLQFTLIDANNDGISIFSLVEEFGYTMAEGDEIIIQGEITQFRGLAQIEPSSLRFVSSGNTLFEPTVVTALNEDTESQLVKINNVTLGAVTTDSGGLNAEISNGTTTFTMSLDADTGLTEADIPTSAFNVIGIGGQLNPDDNAPFDGGYQILPRFLSDFEIVSGTFDPGLASAIKIFPNPAQEQVQVNMAEAFESLRILDVLGREVMRIVSPSLNETIQLSKLQTGVYHVQFVKDSRFWTSKLVKQ